MRRLSGKTAIVTGAASGFGLATARLFAAEGAQVVIGDIDEDRSIDAAKQIEADGGDVEVVVGDVSQRATAEALVERAVSRFGRLDVLVNNAGIVQPRPPTGSWDMEEDDWDRVIRVNLRSAYVCSRAAIPAMRAKANGSIVNVASIAATVSVGGAAYAATKGALISFSRHIAVEVAPEVRVNCVSPGYMWTPMSTGERSGFGAAEQEERRALLAGMSPMGRVGSADDIAHAILFFAGDESKFITGRDLVVDGGHVIASWPRPGTES